MEFDEVVFRGRVVINDSADIDEFVVIHNCEGVIGQRDVLLIVHVIVGVKVLDLAENCILPALVELSVDYGGAVRGVVGVATGCGGGQAHHANEHQNTNRKSEKLFHSYFPPVILTGGACELSPPT